MRAFVECTRDKTYSAKRNQSAKTGGAETTVTVALISGFAFRYLICASCPGVSVHAQSSSFAEHVDNHRDSVKEKGTQPRKNNRYVLVSCIYLVIR